MNNFILYLYIYEILFLYFDGFVLVSLINCIVFKLKLSKKKLNYYVVEDMVIKFYFFLILKWIKMIIWVVGWGGGL